MLIDALASVSANAEIVAFAIGAVNRATDDAVLASFIYQQITSSFGRYVLPSISPLLADRRHTLPGNCAAVTGIL